MQIWLAVMLERGDGETVVMVRETYRAYTRAPLVGEMVSLEDNDTAAFFEVDEVLHYMAGDVELQFYVGDLSEEWLEYLGSIGFVPAADTELTAWELRAWQGSGTERMWGSLLDGTLKPAREPRRQASPRAANRTGSAPRDPSSQTP